jgi:hypothetical protein
VRRLFRILLNGLTVLSLVLALALAGLWVRSYWLADSLHWVGVVEPGGWGRLLGLDCGGGGAAIHVGAYAGSTERYGAPGRWRWQSRDARPVDYAGGSWGQRLGFKYASQRGGDFRWRAVVFPLWVPTVLFAALPLARGAMFVRRRRRVRGGHCVKCGYDLRATPERCPECGAVPAES